MIPSMERQFLIIFWWWLRHCSWERVPRNLLMILLRCHFRRCFFSPSITSRNFIRNSMYLAFSSSVQCEVEYCFFIGGLSSRLQITFLGRNTQGLNLLSSRLKEAGRGASWEHSGASCMEQSLIPGVQQYYQSAKYYQNLSQFKNHCFFQRLTPANAPLPPSPLRKADFYSLQTPFYLALKQKLFEVTTKIRIKNMEL